MPRLSRLVAAAPGSPQGERFELPRPVGDPPSRAVRVVRAGGVLEGSA